MRGREEIAAVHSLTPGQILVTWPREKAAVEAVLRKGSVNLFSKCRCFGICVARTRGRHFLPLSGALFRSALPEPEAQENADTAP